MLSLDELARRFKPLLVGIYAAGIAALAVSLFVGRGGDIIVGDAAEAFEYARVLATTGNLPETPIRFPCGVPMLGSLVYLPAYAIGQLLQAAGVVDGNGWSTGWAIPLQIAYCVPLLALSVAGFAANLSMLRSLGFDDRVAKPAILFWIVTTNVGYYVFKEPAMSESATYATVSLYYCFLVRWFHADESTAGDWIRRGVLLGVFLGLAGTIRQQNILHALSLPLLLIARRNVASESGAFAKRISALAVTAIVSAGLFAIPWLVWAASTGEVRLISYDEGHFYWTTPKPWLVLFVPGYHGWLLFHPVNIIAIAGLAPFLRWHRALAPAVIVAISIQLYLISTWYWLSFGASIGHRGFMTVMPLLLVGFAAAIRWAAQRERERELIATIAVLTLANALIITLVLAQVLDPTGAGNPANAGFG